MNNSHASDIQTAMLLGLRENGFFYAREIAPVQLADIASGLGIITKDRRAPEAFRSISPERIESARPNTLSSRYGLGAFPFHTDAAHWTTPPDYVMLFCKNPGRGGRCTQLVDTHNLTKDGAIRQALKSAVWTTGHLSPHFCVAAHEAIDGLQMRYDPACMTPAGPESHKLQQLLDLRIAESTRSTIPWVKGSLLVIDNKRMLHARGKASTADPDRVLVRVLIGGVQ